MRRLVHDRGHRPFRGGLRQDLVDVRGRTHAALRLPQSIHAGQVVHRHAIGLHVVVTDDRVRGLAQLLLGVAAYDALSSNTSATSGNSGLCSSQSAVLPVAVVAAIEALIETAAPLGIGIRRVVTDHVVGRAMDLEPRRQFVQQLPRHFLGSQRLEGGRIRLAPHQLFRLNDLTDARGRLQQQATVLGLHQDAARQFDFAPVAPNRDMFQRHRAAGRSRRLQRTASRPMLRCLQQLRTNQAPFSGLLHPPDSPIMACGLQAANRHRFTAPATTCRNACRLSHRMTAATTK